MEERIQFQGHSMSFGNKETNQNPFFVFGHMISTYKATITDHSNNKETEIVSHLILEYVK